MLLSMKNDCVFAGRRAAEKQGRGDIGSMKGLKKIFCVVICCCVLCTQGALFASVGSAAEKTWAGTWSTSPIMLGYFYRGTKFCDFLVGCSVRTVLKTTTGGEKVRLRFSNRYGDAPLEIEAVRIARTGKMSDTEIIDGTSLPVTFNGSETVSIPAGQNMYSDPVDMYVEAFEKISVSVYYRSFNSMTTGGLINALSYVDTGNRVDAKTFSANAPLTITEGPIDYHTTPFLCGMDVYGENKSAVVFFGDSTLANDAPYYLAEKMTFGGETNTGVLQEAIIGNKLLNDSVGATSVSNLYGDAAIARFKEDVLDQSGVRAVYVKVGLNDILHQISKSLGSLVPHVTVNDIVAGYTKLINMAHEKGIPIYFFSRQAWKGYQRNFFGSDGEDLVWTQQTEDLLVEINQWLKFSSGADGYIDVKTLSDPQDPNKTYEKYTTDGVHLSELGARVLVDTMPSYCYGSGSFPSIVDYYENGGTPLIRYTPAERYTVIKAPATTVPAAVDVNASGGSGGSSAGSAQRPAATNAAATVPSTTSVIMTNPAGDAVTEVFLVEMPNDLAVGSGQNAPAEATMSYQSPPAEPIKTLTPTARFGIILFTFLTVGAVSFGVIYAVNKKQSVD